MITVPRHVLRGRPRPPAPVHILAARELTAAMRQLRVATGDSLSSAVAMLNPAITSLYPGATWADAGTHVRAHPHLVDEAFLQALEKGHHSRLDLYRLPAWINLTKVGDRTRLYTSRVPGWLVRAYDLAFGADGYLVDMYAWSNALLADQLRDVPRRLRDLPAHVPPGRELDFFTEHFPDTDGRVSAVLAAQAEAVVGLRDVRSSPNAPWWPSAADESSAEDETPEGLLVAPDSQLVASWVLHNTGSVPWRHRVVYRVGSYLGGVRTPAFIVIPDVDPGSSVRIQCPMRVPKTPGTYRACLKQGWPDGTYCFPTTLLGLFVTVVVAPADLIDPLPEWVDHAG
ncbi:NBR1-Ig-like domain-containing protein [Actinophytocola sp.]|uniref:NBR1-Ig-like domain-containing protein n=1 Tax=Actinophytocola sp. TaxID=1872138 RepID=UPI00389B19F1